MSRRFSLAQAQALLPQVARLMSKAGAMHAKHRAAEDALRDLTHLVHLSGGMRLDPARVSTLRALREEGARGVEQAVEELAEMGVLVKDLEVGLADFPTLYRGREVLLCWKSGEESIEYWHGLEEGYRGRKRIDQDFLDHHSGDDVEDE